MKKIIFNSLTVAFCFSLLVSCKKDEITVEKNDSTTWEIDKKIEDNDIRTQLGYDPRLNYIYLRPTVADLPMLSFGNVTINRNYTKEVEVRLLDKPYDKDVQVSFAYDASAYDKVKADYSGFELGDANLVQLSEATKTLSKGETSVTFTLTISNNSNFNKKVILPYALKVTDSGLTLPKGKGVFVLKVFPEEIKITAESKVVSKLLGYYNGSVYIGNSDKEVAFTIKSSYELPTGLKVALVRDDSAVLSGRTLAPAGVEGTLPEDNFDALSKKLTFNLNEDSFTNKGEYALPLKYVVKDASGNEQELSNNKLFVNFDIKELVSSNDNVEVGTQPSGKIIDRKGIIASYYGDIYYSPRFLLDGDENTYSYVRDGAYYYFTFPKVRLIKSVVLKPISGNQVKNISAYAGMTQGSEQYQGTITYNGSGDIVITFKKAIPLIRLSVGNFVNDENASSYWMGFSEINFYEE
ncbi:hypothetical protein Coch_1391 [Capnocytophaga ochracea DSM 7271]|uniref:BT-3987-like N-terminal domain-containing protein n=1 Tax=Capnocytophaga ochracea (strain ATCC 27872 / DSM 7271 / CCUG 9716 / JCM 12966 / NCTC 12371 / SS31 / VPI 2845) TaxID=521097 RepID=C7M5X8_CAPOD|nr:DUF1735 domain-containing protein [Capnocytophaga ochracea]ACU92937.1 hypothetical protein Coch_1391 [Capnocytophaga ochracea DSM 7271]UAK51640.1 DUF1735 domain-containing protein [Capnocytophaga ochracea]